MIPIFWGNMTIHHMAFDSFESQQFCSIGVPVPENDVAVSLQELLMQWWTLQATEGHACNIIEAPPILMLQLLRYQYRAGQAYRIATHVSVNHDIHLPCSGLSPEQRRHLHHLCHHTASGSESA